MGLSLRLALHRTQAGVWLLLTAESTTRLPSFWPVLLPWLQMQTLAHLGPSEVIPAPGRHGRMQGGTREAGLCSASSSGHSSIWG